MTDSSPNPSQILREALGRPGGAADRRAFIQQRCRGNPAALREALAALDLEESRTLIEPTRAEGSPPDASAAPARPGLPSHIGRYRILDLLGEGGMGVVYLAEQERPRRTVALKVIRPGLLTPRLLHRFELETHTLARLQHPGIAQVYDAGSITVPGSTVEQPFIAMEYVRGEPLNDHAEHASLSTPDRLRLFIKVCEAVQHAHQRGVIHRDLKSSNILVTTDGTHEPSPKILDFGVAKIADSEAAQPTLHTLAGQIVGTVPYMSPEQIAGSAADVDTRSDVYTLGVVLFELLTGRLPHAVSGRTLVEASRIITIEEAPRLGSLGNHFKGDLETIAAKAIEKDRDRRYQSPADLAADIERYLTDQPILARPASTVYQLTKFARRNRPVVVAAAVALGVLILGVLGISWQAVEATRGRELAEDMRASADEAKMAAIRESETARQINALLIDMLQSADPDNSLGRDVTVIDALDATAAELQGSTLDPHVLIAVRSTLTSTYQSLGQSARAEPQARATLALAESHFGARSLPYMQALAGLAHVLSDQSRFAEAEPLARRAADLALDHFGEQSAEHISALTTLSRVLHESGQLKDSAAVLDRALALAASVLGERHPDTLIAMHNKASSLKDEGRFDEAIEMFRRVISLRTEVFGPRHSQTLSSMNNLAATLQKAGRSAEALDLLTRILELRREMYGDDHIATITILSNIAVCHVAMKQLDQAAPLVRQALDGYTRVAGETHNKTLITMANLAYLEEDRGNLEEAERLYRRVIDIRSQGKDPNVPELLGVMNNLAMLLHAQGRVEEARQVYADLMPRCKTALPAGHYLAAIFASNYGDCLTDLGRLDEAEPILRQSLAELEASLGDKHARTQKARDRLDKLSRHRQAGSR